MKVGPYGDMQCSGAPVEQHGASITSGCCFRRVSAVAGSFPDSLISFLELDRDIFVCSTALPYHYLPPPPSSGQLRALNHGPSKPDNSTRQRTVAHRMWRALSHVHAHGDKYIPNDTFGLLAVRFLEMGVSCWWESSKEKLFLTHISAEILSSKRVLLK